MFRRLGGDRWVALAMLVIASVAAPSGFAQSAYPAKPLTSTRTLAFGHRLRGKEGDSYGAMQEKPLA